MLLLTFSYKVSFIYKQFSTYRRPQTPRQVFFVFVIAKQLNWNQGSWRSNQQFVEGQIKKRSSRTRMQFDHGECKFNFDIVANLKKKFLRQFYFLKNLPLTYMKYKLNVILLHYCFAHKIFAGSLEMHSLLRPVNENLKSVSSFASN